MGIKELWDNESAQVGTLFMVVIMIFVLALVYMLLGYAVDSFIDTTNTIPVVMSEYRYNAISFLQRTFNIMPIIFGIVIIVYAIKKAADRRVKVYE